MNLTNEELDFWEENNDKEGQMPHFVHMMVAQAKKANLLVKDWYEHEHSPSVFVMFDRFGQCHWCYSGNELRRIYLEVPERFVSMPIEVPIPEEVDKKLTEMYDNY